LIVEEKNMVKTKTALWCLGLSVLCSLVAHPAGATESGEAGPMKCLRTPDSRFENLPGYDFEPHYLFVDDPGREPGNEFIRVHYTFSGPSEGPTLLLMHGNPSWSFLFREIVPIINAAGYRTVMFDYVGHGRSDKPTRESDYTYDRHLEWIRQVIEKLDNDPDLDLDRVVLMGHDYGHPFGMRLITHHYPDRFDGFINGNAGLNRGLRGLAQRHVRWRGFVRENPDVPIGAVICRRGIPPCPAEVEAGYNAPYPGPEYKASIRAFPEMVPEDPTWPQAKANQVAWDYMTASWTKPYMVIRENYDLPDRLNRRDEFISQIPGAYGLEHPQFVTGHYAPEDNPEGVAAAVIRFLDDIYEPHAFDRVLFTDFSSGLERFGCGGDDCSYDADVQAVKLQKNSGEASAAVQKTSIDLSKAVEMKVAFRFIPKETDAGDELLVELWDGSKWINVLSMKRGEEFGKGDFFNESTDYGYVRLGRDDVDFSSDAKIRIRCGSQTDNGAIFVKDIGIYVRK
jgi:haloalkane dehalogenase